VAAPLTASALTATDVARQAGVAVFAITEGRNPVFDFNRDGIPDVLMNLHMGNPSILKRGLPGGGFVTATTFASDDRHGCVAADFGSPNHGLPDGLPDLFCTLGSCFGRAPPACDGRIFHRELWLQRPGGGWVDEGPAWNVSRSEDRGRDVAVVSIMPDGLPDLVTAAEGSDEEFSPNRLFINRGGRFEEQVGSPIRREGDSDCVAVLRRADGGTDIFFCANVDTTPGIGVLTYRGLLGGNAFADVTRSQRYRGVRTRHITLADVVGDARPDLIITAAGRISIWRNVGDLFPFETVGFAVPASFWTEACDVDRDGDDDLFVVAGRSGGVNAPDVVLLNGAGSELTRFTALPRAADGGGDTASCIRNYPGGTAVLVSNGRFTDAGTYQLIRFVR
jgi:hypothetical protein